MGSQLGLVSGLEEGWIGRGISEWGAPEAAGESEGLREGLAPLPGGLKLPFTWPARGHADL